MYEVVIIKADYEGWWLFDGWQEDIIKRYKATDLDNLLDTYNTIIDEMKHKYNSHITGKYNIIAFFNACDLEYCEDCEEDMQIYYTPLMTKNNEFFNYEDN